MKKQINNKRFSFITIVIFSILAINSSCKKETVPPGSTIIYTDVNPDSPISGNSVYSLDLNNDGIYDFNFNSFSQLIKCNTRNMMNDREDAINVTIPGGNNNGIIFFLNQNYAACLDSLTMINSAGKWSYVTAQSLTMYSLSTCVSESHNSYGYWYILGGNLDKYMGLKLIKDSKVYYGWVRLYLNTYLRKLIVKDYAYNSTPNQPILAGQKK